MSDEIKNSAGNAGDGIQESGAALCCVEVKCPRPVYRRAGYSLVRGKNTLDGVTAQQLAVLRADPVLTVAVVSETPASPDGESRGLGVLDVGDLNDRIRDAVATLDKDNPDHYTQAGAPRVAAVCDALGETITSEQLKAALAGTNEG
ncbi:HI1506-related protein [Erwinia sp. HR93]|uniref:HI1506-related protein n=1 Tax=Erwinia sp. HR93 TaxID=3094840 RepID=UPI002ADEF721|nr:HI1506-related protein [Erwinia sp. HR93]MEA1063938.1 HI1506-related protein [Erwinia sp. HR93]